MSIINSQPLIGASGQGGYFLSKSLRFRSSASAYLNRTPASAGNRKTWTWSGWVKRGALANGVLLGTETVSAQTYCTIYYVSDKIYLDAASSNVETMRVYTNAVFRDPSAWYHVVVYLDTTQATASNRTAIYVNGVLQTLTVSTNPAQNLEPLVNSTVAHNIGRNPLNGIYFDGYLTEVNFIDGQALTPSSFGETSTSTGVWIPKKYTGTYGTNGFYLPFTDVATTSGSNAGLGKDFSGNGNYWTTNNISVTSGSTYDSMKDVPTLTDTDTANYWTLNPLNTGQLGTVQSGNLEWIGGDQNNFRTVAAQILPTTGKFYWEVTPIGGGSGGAFVSGIYIGIMNYANGGTGLFASGVRIADTGRDDYVYYSDGRKVNSNSFVSYGNSYAANDVIGIAVDIDNGKIWYSKNGTWQASGDPAAGTNAAYTTVPFSTKTYAPAMSAAEITNAQKFNFGQRPFAYTPPTGFKALNTFNLPTPTIGATASSQANKYMDATTYTGNGTSLSVVNAGSFQPDFVWIKSRVNNPSGGSLNHVLTDSVRGVTKELNSNNTGAESTNSAGLTAFNSNGFSVGGDYNYNNPGNGGAMVGWQWRASNTTAVTNTAGSITSTVSANTTAGFSIVAYNGTGIANATVGHGLGVAPSMIIFKNRQSVFDWPVYHSAVGASNVLFLNTTAAQTSSSIYINGVAPTSTVFTLGTSGSTNSGANQIAYCFAQVAGYSAFGSYTGNGSTDGPFVFTGFRPKFVLIKQSSASGEAWTINDGSRNTYNVTDSILYPNASDAEGVGSGAHIDFLSNGFKIRNNNPRNNANGSTYIYACFAENPFKYSNAR